MLLDRCSQNQSKSQSKLLIQFRFDFIVLQWKFCCSIFGAFLVNKQNLIWRWFHKFWLVTTVVAQKLICFCKFYFQCMASLFEISMMTGCTQCSFEYYRCNANHRHLILQYIITLTSLHASRQNQCKVKQQFSYWKFGCKLFPKVTNGSIKVVFEIDFFNLSFITHHTVPFFMIATVVEFCHLQNHHFKLCFLLLLDCKWRVRWPVHLLVLTLSPAVLE